MFFMVGFEVLEKTCRFEFIIVKGGKTNSSRMMKRCFGTTFLGAGLWLLLTLFDVQIATAQYFGTNKPSYRAFNFKVYRTPHFEIYHYLKNDSVLNRLAQLSEQWYSLHSSVFKDTFKTQNPIIFYNDQSDFQQTTAISGEIGVGTGGVTEALKNRVVLPIASTYAQTDHVLGHELVHAFQYHLLLESDSGSLENLQRLPLWMVEGMAEYFSIGSMDAHTSMWMRDAIVNNDFPTLEDMTYSSKYFPYRYGQCFWAMVGKTWGDSVIIPLFKESARNGYEYALRRKLGFNEQIISNMWKQALVGYYSKYLDIALTTPVGKKILFTKTAGDMNFSPSVSPDGKNVIFYSEKDAFTIELFLADAHTGRIIRKISSTINNSEVDAFNYVESAGTWSPDGSKFAFTIFANGFNKLMVVNVKNGRKISEFAIPGVPSFNNPAWSPVEDKIAVSGMLEGRNSMYVYDLKSKTTTRVTDDSYSYVQPTWSSDGKLLAFSTDRPLTKGASIDPQGGMNLGYLNLETREMKLFNVFAGAKNLNPLFSPDNKSLFFLSNRDGFRNLYRYSIDSASVFQMTRFFTGISGITEFSPAISVARNQDLVNYSYYYGGKYSIYSAALGDFKPFQVKSDSINFDAATLPPLKRAGLNLIDKHLASRSDSTLVSKDSFLTAPYHPKFKLDYISNVNMGVATSRFGTGMAGSVFAIFSDMVGQNQVYTTLAVNGEIYDFGGQVAYLNSKHKINWGVSLSHIPYTYAYPGYNPNDSISSGGTTYHVQNYPMYVYRIFEDKASLFATRPLSATRRIEFGISAAYYSERLEAWNYYYDADNNYVGSSKSTLGSPPGYSRYSLDQAYVIDNSVFGMTSPIRGKRIRLGMEEYTGADNFVTFLVDYRKYLYLKPYTFAFRFYQYGRYGTGAENSRMNNLYLGYPWYVRGYETVSGSYSQSSDTLNFTSNLVGSKIALFNFEFRLPLLGPKHYALVKSNFFYTDFAVFADAGLAWTGKTHPALKWERTDPSEQTPVVSTGLSLRFNILGYMVLEPFYAFPLNNGWFAHPVFGLNFLPGW
jgi:Tol biopolymer transport system component